MKTYKVTYSNYNYRTVSRGVRAENPEEAILMLKKLEGGLRVAVEKVDEISEAEYLEFPTESYLKNIRC